MQIFNSFFTPDIAVNVEEPVNYSQYTNSEQEKITTQRQTIKYCFEDTIQLTA